MDECEEQFIFGKGFWKRHVLSFYPMF